MVVPLSAIVAGTYTSTGTGPFTVAAYGGRQTLATAFGASDPGAGNRPYLFIWNQSSVVEEWAVVTGHMTSATSLTIDSTILSSNANATVTWGAGTKYVSNDIPASMQAWLSQSNIFVADQQTFQYNDDGAAAGPTLQLYRNSASPAAADVLGTTLFQGKDSAGNTTIYASEFATLLVATDTLESGQLSFMVMNAGALTRHLTLRETCALVGDYSTPIDASGSTFPALQVAGTSASTAALLSARYSANANGPRIYFAKSRSATIGAHTIVQSGDDLGSISWQASNGTAFENAVALIQVLVDGTPGASTDMPTRMSFWTTPDASATAVERLRISNAGVVSVLAATASTSTTTGAIVVSGGAGIAGALYVGGATSGNSVSMNGSLTDASNTGVFNFAPGINFTTGGVQTYGLINQTALVCSGGSSAGYANFFQLRTNMVGGATLPLAITFYARNTLGGASPSGTVGSLIAFFLDDFANQTTGTPSVTVTECAGLRINNQGAISAVSGFTFPTVYGLYIAAQTADTVAYGIYSLADVSISAAFGYIAAGTGAGGTVTQTISKSTTVVLNTYTGQITMNAAALLNSTSISFTLTNSRIAANDMLVLQQRSGTIGYFISAVCAAGSASVTIRNQSGGSLSEAIILQFFLLKGTLT